MQIPGTVSVAPRGSMAPRGAVAGIVVLGLLGSCASSPDRVALIAELEAAEIEARDTGRADLFVARAARGLRSADVVVRMLAAQGLGRTCPRAATDLLAARLPEERDPGVRRALVEALTRIGEPASARSLRGVLRDPQDPLRGLAIRGLGAVREDDRRAIRDALEDGDAEVRLEAMLAYVRRPTLELSGEALARRLSTAEDERVRWAAAQALSARPALANSVADTLAVRAVDRNFLVSYHVVRALAGLDDVVGFEAVASVARDRRRPWLAQLAAFETLRIWLERDVSGAAIGLSAARREVAEGVVVDAAERLARADEEEWALTPPLLASAVRGALAGCGCEAARLVRDRLAASPRPVAAGRVAGTRPARDDPGPAGSTYRSPYLEPGSRGPRLLLGVEGRGTVVFELFVDSAPVRVGRLLELVRRGDLARPRIQTHADPPGVLFSVPEDDPELESEVPPAEPSSRRILGGSLVERPGFRGPGRFLVTLRPVPEWEGRVAVLGRVLLGQEQIRLLEDGAPAFLDFP